MKTTHTNRIAAVILLVFAIAWSVTVYRTVPAAAVEGQIGPREFPLILGLVLIVMSTLLLLWNLDSGQTDEQTDDDDRSSNARDTGSGKFALGVFALIILFGFLMERVGFLITVPIIIIGTLAGILKVRNPVLILVLAIGITAGCWLVFNKLLGIYMPPGRWISLV